MTSSSSTETRASSRRWIPAAGEPHDRCSRCGRPTPVGVSLCEDDNPARIGAPSTTQAHGTIFLGVVAGFVLLALAGRFALGSVGPFSASIESAASRTGGGLQVALQVTNDGSSEASATCRLSRGGVAAPDDPVFQTPRIGAGQTLRVTQSVNPPPAGRPPFAVERLSVACR